MTPFDRFQEQTSAVYVPRELRSRVPCVLAYSHAALLTEQGQEVRAFAYAEGEPVAGLSRIATFDDTNLLASGKVCAPGEVCLVTSLGIYVEPWWHQSNTNELHRNTSVELEVFGCRLTFGSVDMCRVELATCPGSEPVRDGRRVLDPLPFPEPIKLTDSATVAVRLRCEREPAASTKMYDRHHVQVLLIGLRAP